MGESKAGHRELHSSPEVLKSFSLVKKYTITEEPAKICINSNSGSPLYQHPFTQPLYKLKSLMNKKFPDAVLNKLSLANSSPLIVIFPRSSTLKSLPNPWIFLERPENVRTN